MLQLAISGSLTTGTLAAMGILVARIYMPLTSLTNARVDLMTAFVSFDRVFERDRTHRPLMPFMPRVSLGCRTVCRSRPGRRVCRESGTGIPRSGYPPPRWGPRDSDAVWK